MHLVIGGGNGLQFEVFEPVDFELEGESRFQMAIDAVFHELRAGAEGVVFGEFPVEEEDEGDATDAAGFELFPPLQSESLEFRPLLFLLERDSGKTASMLRINSMNRYSHTQIMQYAPSILQLYYPQ